MGLTPFDNRFAERNGHAWWSNNTKRLEGQDNKATTAIRVAGIDYGVVKRQLFYRTPEGIEVPTAQYAIERPAFDGMEAAVLGFAGEQYEPLQNGELAEMLDPLTDQWPTETVGALGKGETVFITLNAGVAEVGGDEIRQYLFAYNSHDGNSAFKINVTPVRVVCQNTCITGLKQASVTASINHTRRIRVEAQFAIDLVAQIRKAQDDTLSSLRGLTKIRINEAQVSRLAAAVYPERTGGYKVKQYEALKAAEAAGEIELEDDKLAELVGAKLNVARDNKRAIELQLALHDRYEVFCEDRPEHRGTAWAAYNAVTEMESWRAGGTDAQLAKSVLLGERGARMATAYRELVAMS